MKNDWNFLKTPLVIFVWFSLWSIFENILCLVIGKDQKKQLIAHVILFITVCVILLTCDVHKEDFEESSPSPPPMKKKSGG